MFVVLVMISHECGCTLSIELGGRIDKVPLAGADRVVGTDA
jgi:hypothetical protein